MTHGFSPEVDSKLALSIATGQPPSGIEAGAKDQLADEINDYGSRVIDLAWTIAEQRKASQVGTHEVALAVAASQKRREWFDWPAWGGGFSLGVLGNSIPDWFPYKDVSGETVGITIVALVATGVFACFAVWRALT